MNKKPKKRHSPTQIRHHLLQQQKSNLSIKAYCQQHTIHVQAFYSWRKRYKTKILVKNASNTAPADKSAISFTSLGTLNTKVQSSALFDIRLPEGTTVSIYPGTTAKEFAPFMALLSGNKKPF